VISTIDRMEAMTEAWNMLALREAIAAAGDALEP